MRVRIAGALVMIATLAVSPAAAQGHHGMPADSGAATGMMQVGSGMMHGGAMQGGMMQMMQAMHGQSGMMGGMMGMTGGPAMVLRLRGYLELTDDQVAQIEALRDSASAEARGHMMQGMQAMHGASALLAPGSEDVDAYTARLREAANHMVMAHAAMARAAVATRDVLTADQQDRLATAREVMKAMGGGMMNGGGMMGGGTNP